MTHVPDPERIVTLLDAWATEKLPEMARIWLASSIAKTARDGRGGLFLAFPLASRIVGKADLVLDERGRADAKSARPGWTPVGWTLDQLARTRILLAFPSREAAEWRGALDLLARAGEVRELVALYQALPLLPFPDAHADRAREGLRTNMKPVFAAVAHYNPYPFENFDDDSWNQMVLKCLFIGLTLDPITGLDRRANPALAKMLSDYAHERWAAGRTVSPELWRGVGPFASGEMLTDLERVVASHDRYEKMAAALALSACPDPAAVGLLDRLPAERDGVADGTISWRTVGA